MCVCVCVCACVCARTRVCVGLLVLKHDMSQLGGIAEYTNCISAEWVRLPQRVSWYDTMQSDGEASVMLKL